MKPEQIHRYFIKAKSREYPVCKQVVYPQEDFEIVVTKRKSINIYHTKCIK